jgi:hypothetical protein
VGIGATIHVPFHDRLFFQVPLSPALFRMAQQVADYPTTAPIVITTVALGQRNFSKQKSAIGALALCAPPSARIKLAVAHFTKEAK